MDATQKAGVQDYETIENYDVLQQLGGYYTSIGDFDQAKCCFEKAASLEPDEPGPYIGLGVVALQADLFDDADLAFRVACRLAPDCAKAYCGRAMVAQQKADYKQAFDMYLKCLEQDGDNLTALLGLFQTSCQMGSFLKVIYYLEIYLKAHPKDTSVMFSLAALYMKDGRFTHAQKTLSELLTLDPDKQDAAGLLEEVEHNLAQIKQAQEK